MAVSPRRQRAFAVGNNSVWLFGRQFALPRSRILRMSIGGAFVVGGLLGFLPILGFWMVPLGAMILSVDLPVVRRWRRRFSVWWERRRAGPRRDRPSAEG
ncbi:hypothetical protein [Consotaella salsifontis]|uniref:Transmembrane protein (PGPGW) n=1 Tax=Consotaella salsifontis TaxID=1365950 RepID=A0A1T4T7C7_9HYPH|nr:hypothetical protein [Consotaella salsifontis]SKA36410.1 hypothetical protein SAMN05428963_12081 [Consotaella salsifontis]